MNKFSKLAASAAVAVSLLSVAAPTFLSTVQASTVNPSVTDKDEVQNSSTLLTENEINKLDKYVSVENNRYVLNVPDNSQFSTHEISMAKAMVEESNRIVASNNVVINPVTKTTSGYVNQAVVNITRSKYSPLVRSTQKGYTFKNFWWGTRYYFRSNYAVYQMDHELDGYAILSGTLGALATTGTAAAVDVVGAAYFQKVKSDLDYMNNTHPHNYLYMDVNLSGIYTIKVLK